MDKYVAKDCKWIDGKRADVLLVIIHDVTKSLPSVIREVQNIADKDFMHQLSKYCHYIYHHYCQEPIDLIVYIKRFMLVSVISSYILLIKIFICQFIFKSFEMKD